MIYVTSLDGSQVEPLNSIASDFKWEQSVDGSLTISFTTINKDNPAFDILQNKSVVTIDGYDFVVEQSKSSIDQKSIVAISTFFNLSKVRKNEWLNGSRSINERVAFVLSGTGWTYSIDSNLSTKSVTIPQFGHSNVINLINNICAMYECEYEIQSNNHVHFANEIGADNDFQYRYKHNLSDVVLNEDTTKLATTITAEGKDGLTVTYTSPNVAIFGLLEAEPIKDERFTNADNLMEYARKTLVDYPEIAIESRTIELTERELGERVWLIYEPLGIEMKTRVIKQTKVLRGNKLVTDSVVFGTTLPKTIVESFVESKKEYRSKFEQTDDRITMEVEKIDESIATLDIKADNINLNVNNRITNEVARIDVRADNIALSVEAVETSLATLDIKVDNIELSVNNRITNEVAAIDVRADLIEQSVSNLSGSVSSSISILQSQISLKVDKSGVISSINLSPEAVTISASKINLNGAVMVNGIITGSTSLNITQDIYVGNNIYLGQSHSGMKMIRFSEGATIAGGHGSFFSDLSFSGSTMKFSGGYVDFSEAVEITWGSNAPVARFG